MRRPPALLGFLAGLLSASTALAGPSASSVGEAIALRRAQVEEFRLIKEAAEELGIRVWLFGGTAAGFAHYVRWDLAREAGDARYRESFFDYDFTNIYRSTQDADLVVDATREQAEQLENLIKKKMSFLQGSKEHWEVRLLRQDRVARGGQVKQALLHNPDFLGQHTDSNSTGMIELTDPPPGEAVVRDLRDWESARPFFLEDVTDGRLHYYWSATHQETSRFLAGDNPPLFSVIRYLVKAFQYDLAVEGEDLARVQAIIDAFDPQRDYPDLSPWAKGWLERYGCNLIRHSVNIEYAWNTLERLGLRQKLITLSRPAEQGSLGWWLSREPLRTHAVGEGAGKTASELGIEVVAHETSDFLAYESITRDTTLRPNVLISRPGHPGEAASSGPGFYTRRGRAGAKGTGLTIRFRVDPQAREGTDFTVHDEFVLVTNRAALQVIPESLQASLFEYLEMLRNGAVDPSDRGAWMKLKRRLSLRPPSKADEDRIVAMLREEIARISREGVGPGYRWAVLQEWFTLPISQGHPELVDQLAVAVSEEIERVQGLRRDRPPVTGREPRRAQRGWGLELLHRWLALPVSSSRPEVLEKLHSALSAAADATYSNESAAAEAIFPLARAWFALPAATTDLRLFETLLDRHAPPDYVEWGKNGYPHWDWGGLFFAIVRAPHWSDPGMVRALIHRRIFFEAASVLEEPAWRTHPELLLELIDAVPAGSMTYAMQLAIARTPILWAYPEPLRKMLGRGEGFLDHLPRFVTRRDYSNYTSPEVILVLLEALDEETFDFLLKDRGWLWPPRLRELCGGQDPNAACLRQGLREVAAHAEAVSRGVAGLTGADADCRERP